MYNYTKKYSNILYLQTYHSIHWSLEWFICKKNFVIYVSCIVCYCKTCTKCLVNTNPLYISSITFNWHKTSFEGVSMKNHIAKANSFTLHYPSSSFDFLTLVDLHCANSLHPYMTHALKYYVPLWNYYSWKYKHKICYVWVAFLWFMRW